MISSMWQSACESLQPVGDPAPSGALADVINAIRNGGRSCSLGLAETKGPGRGPCQISLLLGYFHDIMNSNPKTTNGRDGQATEASRMQLAASFASAIRWQGSRFKPSCCSPSNAGEMPSSTGMHRLQDDAGALLAFSTTSCCCRYSM